jgi:hypothetical protein
MIDAKIMLIGIGSIGEEAVNRLVANGIDAHTVMILDDKLLTPTRTDAFRFLPDDPTYDTKIAKWMSSEIKNQNLGKADLCVLIGELGRSLSFAFSPLLLALAEADVNTAVMGILPPSEDLLHDDAIIDSDSMEEMCNYYFRFPIGDIQSGVESDIEIDVWEHAMNYVYQASELLLNGWVSGFKKASDQTIITGKVEDLFGEGKAYHGLHIGQGDNSLSAFQKATKHYCDNEKSVIVSVTGGESAIAETVNLARERFGGELWILP